MIPAGALRVPGLSVPGLSVPGLPMPTGTQTRSGLRASGALTSSRVGKCSSEASTSQRDALHVPASCTGSALDSTSRHQRGPDSEAWNRGHVPTRSGEFPNRVPAVSVTVWKLRAKKEGDVPCFHPKERRRRVPG